jgi:orotate phosphoribosyltransferase
MTAASRFLELLLESEVLRFGSFKTKSGRMSPFFFNTGNIDSGFRLTKLAEIYSDVILEKFGLNVDNLFGPAYKGIPLAAAVSQALARKMQRDVSFTYNRKEAKDHGEGGSFVGRQYHHQERVLIIEDVLTGGTSLRETLTTLSAKQVQVIGALVGVDRQEKGLGELSARAEIENEFKIPVKSILSIDQVVSELYNKTVSGRVWIDDEGLKDIKTYRSKFGR